MKARHSVYLGTQSDGGKKGLSEPSAALPLLCVNCSASTTHASTYPLEPQIHRKRLSSPAGACGLSRGWISHQEEGFTALNHRLLVGHPAVGALWFHRESVWEEHFQARNHTRGGIIQESCVLKQPTVVIWILRATGCQSVCKSVFFPIPHHCFHIWNWGVFTQAIFPLTRSVLKSFWLSHLWVCNLEH